MKKLLFFVLVMAAIQAQLPAQNVSQDDALIAAKNFMMNRNPGMEISQSVPFLDASDTLAWVMHCRPSGFIVITANPDMTPILAWSSEGNFGEGEAWKSFLPVFRQDLKIRNQYANTVSTESEINRRKWNYWLHKTTMPGGFQQWPPEGWSPTGGWLFTNWTQSAPYNAMCPIDGQTHSRSVAGCPATAMAQIVNYHSDLYGTRFTNEDDYYHNFGTGNQYWIDNDWATFSFPSWEQLNVYLDTLEVHFASGATLKNDDKAALTYACGAAARQVYSSSVSGTYGINQAYDAFIRFGYADAQLIYPSDTSLNNHIAQNIIIGLPSQLGLVNPDETAGHNVVVDGYNTDEFYHFNFGWGGSANGWYTLPPTSIPYNLTVIEGVVLDINLSHPPVAINPVTQDDSRADMVFINAGSILRISLMEQSSRIVTIYDISGRRILCTPLPASSAGNFSDLPLGYLDQGIYIATLESTSGKTSWLKFMR